MALIDSNCVGVGIVVVGVVVVGVVVGVVVVVGGGVVVVVGDGGARDLGVELGTTAHPNQRTSSSSFDQYYCQSSSYRGTNRHRRSQ